ncbi:aldehyde dehydrogenase [Mycolicibacterium chitae]|uniref:Aldehyde dehydrogenase n=1 Tax=Mycolicibacterium chitae TaxID=1792 RepID=A0A3S4T0N7_MYCCI|nr:aldehyde dehydrogenase [Mycolicibacterium chitae]MCV7107862.1 aldehyde dehydrogenase [Mycolicibacterium chitae]BBZ04352.1 aldehyde dehydrogenase [Mycolicibacterium chitae]VEG47989.1 aldehyde dehydrogenase [Mycolicibacterium chitae]
MTPITGQVYIGGQFRPSAEVTPVLEAATGTPLGDGANAGTADVDDAVSAARAALPGWRATPAARRAEILVALAEALKARASSTNELVTRENGMPMSLSRGVNGAFPAVLLNYYAALITALPEEEVRSGPTGHTTVRHEPVGVVGAITPWNYPQALAAFKLAPALAAGCPVVLKPSPETALDAMVFGEAATEAGLPPGVLNIVPGGTETGVHLVAHPGVDKVSFTGSTVAGRAIGEVCGRLLRPVTLELGGKSAAIILDDADLDATLAGLRTQSFTNNGQTCYLNSRVLAPRSRYAEIVEALAELAGSLRVGDPLDPSTEIGPVVSERQRDRILGYIEAGTADGAKLVAGGSIPKDQPRGWFVEPTVFADVDNAHRIAQEEIFGPVLAVIPYDGDEDAIALANDSEYGLGGTVWTTDRERAMSIARQVHTGTIGINGYTLDIAAPFGGVKASGLGRELGPEGLAAFRSVKSIYGTGPS